MPANPESGLVIIGQGPAGTAAAKAFRALNPMAPVTLLTQEKYTCYSRPRLPEVVSGQTEISQISIYPEGWYAEQSIQVLLNRRVAAIDANAKQVLTEDGQSFHYNKLLLATGAQSALPPIAGLPTPQAFVLRTLDDALALRQYALGKQSALLIGGGLLGLEAGYALTRLGLQVTVIEVESRLLPRQVDEEGSALLQEKLIPLGFKFFIGDRVREVAFLPGQIRVDLEGGASLLADLALVSAGINPNVELARAIGIQIGKRGIIVDDYLLTSHPDVYAAGDVAEWRGTIVGLWTVAQAMGRMAGGNAAGAAAKYSGLVAATKLKIVGVDLWSQGDIRPEGATVLARSDPRAGWLMKLFVRQERIVGFIQIGRTHNAGQLRRLLERKIVISGFEDRMLEENFDFSGIPGFSG